MDNDRQKVLIIGAGVAGQELLEELKKKFDKNYNIVGFVDDDPDKLGKFILGLKVLGSIENLSNLIKKHKVNYLLIAIPSATGQLIRKILENSRGAKVSFKVIPRTLELVEGKVNLYDLRELRVEDLLGRAIIKSEQHLFKNEFEGKRILITGAAGSIGSELCRQIIQFNPEHLIALDWSENGLFELGLDMKELVSGANFNCVVGNIQDLKNVRDIVKKSKPDIIFHTAAFKHVPLMQENPIEAVRNNVFGTENVAKTAYEENVNKFIYISTDKAANPKNAMGASKLVGEHLISALNKLGRTKYSSVRFGNVLESHGSVVPIFRKQIASGGPVTVTDPKMTRFVMTITEAVQLVLHSSVLGRGGETFILEMGDQIKIDDLARFMVQMAGFVPDDDIKISYIGARPGEKISEQLTTNMEYIEKTDDERIYRVNKNTDNIDLYDLSLLKSAVDENNVFLTVNVLRKFAPNLLLEEEQNIPFSRASIGEEEKKAVSKVLDSGWFTMGKETVKFEEEFAKYVGVKYAVAVNSCTSALFLSLKALNVGRGDEVIVPAFTFPATVSMIIHCGATPVFADIENENFCLDQKSVEKVISKKTKVILPVHYGGNRASIKAKLPIIEDSAHLIPKGGDNPRSFARCYSFYATKNMTTGEGGMVTTNDQKVAEWLRKARLHGLSQDAWKRYDIKSKWFYEVEFPGWKFNMTDINSALGRVQLKKLDEFERRRQVVVALYNEILGLDNKGTHLYPIMVERREEFLEYMKENGVGCSFHFLALHKQPTFQRYSRGKLPVTEYVSKHVVTLPLDAVITDQEVKRVAELVNKFSEN